MSWIEPKTDWVASDRYNYQDYTRMRNNMIELITLVKQLFSDFAEIDMAEKSSYADRLYAEEFNALEENLRLINENTFRADIGEDTLYASNDKTPNYKEFNRIESAQAMLYDRIMVHVKNAKHLAFRLGERQMPNVGIGEDYTEPSVLKDIYSKQGFSDDIPYFIAWAYTLRNSNTIYVVTSRNMTRNGNDVHLENGYWANVTYRAPISAISSHDSLLEYLSNNKLSQFTSSDNGSTNITVVSNNSSITNFIGVSNVDSFGTVSNFKIAN